MKTGIIIEARLTSIGFPNKVLANFRGTPILERIIDELIPLNLPIIVAIPITKSNDYLAEWLDERKIKLFRGFENDVLNRFFRCAKWNEFDTIIRVCADSPLINAFDLSKLLQQYENQEFPRMIWGMGFWIFSFQELEFANFNIHDAKSREHVVRYMTRTVDYPEDIERLENV